MGMGPWLKIILVVLMMCAALFFNIPLVLQMSGPMCTYIEDKSRIRVEGTIENVTDLKEGKDLMLSLAITDSMSPYPKAVRINDSKVIVLDASFIANREDILARIVSDSGEYKLGKLKDNEMILPTFSYIADPNSEYKGNYIHYKIRDG